MILTVFPGFALLLGSLSAEGIRLLAAYLVLLRLLPLGFIHSKQAGYCKN
jgi:hypothetical protein